MAGAEYASNTICDNKKDNIGDNVGDNVGDNNVVNDIFGEKLANASAELAGAEWASAELAGAELAGDKNVSNTICENDNVGDSVEKSANQNECDKVSQNSSHIEKGDNLDENVSDKINQDSGQGDNASENAGENVGDNFNDKGPNESEIKTEFDEQTDKVTDKSESISELNITDAPENLPRMNLLERFEQQIGDDSDVETEPGRMSPMAAAPLSPILNWIQVPSEASKTLESIPEEVKEESENAMGGVDEPDDVRDLSTKARKGSSSNPSPPLNSTPNPKVLRELRKLADYNNPGLKEDLGRGRRRK